MKKSIFWTVNRLASKDYDGPIRLRKGYFYYRDGVKKQLSDYAE